MLAALCVMLVITALWAAASGALSIPHGKLVPLLWSPAAEGDDAIWRNVLIEVRLPRIVLAITAGAALALSGAVMQALFRNPLAEPGLIGISLGGAAGAVAAIVLGAEGLGSVAPAAFAGSLIATAFAYVLGTRRPGAAVPRQ